MTPAAEREALFTVHDDELRDLREILIEWMGEGFTTSGPRYDLCRDLLARLSLRASRKPH